MGRKAGLTLDDVAAAAAAIADRDGLAAASLTAVAGHLGIRTPSLYNHVPGLDGLRRLLAIRASATLEEAFRSTSAAGDGADRIRAMAEAFRNFATSHRGQYEALFPAPSPGEDDGLYEAMARTASVVADVFVEMGHDQERALHLTRAFRSLLHGFVDLEINQGFGMPLDLDESFAIALDLLVSGAIA
jgi:AcrR family transcriptional regulator